MASNTAPEDSRKTYTHYETQGTPAELPNGKTGFVRVTHKRATLVTGETRDFVMIERGYKTTGERIERFVTIPAELAPAVARVLAPGGAELRTLAERIAESEA